MLLLQTRQVRSFDKSFRFGQYQNLTKQWFQKENESHARGLMLLNVMPCITAINLLNYLLTMRKNRVVKNFWVHACRKCRQKCLFTDLHFRVRANVWHIINYIERKLIMPENLIL